VRPGRIDSRRAFAGQDGWNNQGAIAALVIVSRSRKVNRISQTDETPVKRALLRFCSWRGRNLFTPDSSRYLNCPSNLIGHDHPNKPANGVGNNRAFLKQVDGSRARVGRQKIKKGRRLMFQGHIDMDAVTPVEASAIPDVLFERGLYWASGRSGVVNLVAAHKWFNLAAWKGHSEALPLRREVAEMMSEDEIAMAQREARAWMTAH
jgi:uncharacterized protein